MKFERAIFTKSQVRTFTASVIVLVFLLLGGLFARMYGYKEGTELYGNLVLNFFMWGVGFSIAYIIGSLLIKPRGDK